MIRRSARALASALVLLTPPAAQARITRFVITRVESPTFGGATFGAAGQFEKLVGTAHGEVDPRDPRNAIIQDIELAPRNERGMVEYSTDVYVVKPIDMRRGNGMLLYNVVNRGNKTALGSFNLGSTGGNEPTGAGDGFLQALGYTVIFSGWQPDVLPGGGRMTMSVPVARNPDGSSITGVVRAELKLGPGATASTTTLNLSSGHFTGLTHASYPTVSTDNRTPLSDGFLPTLTRRTSEAGARIPISNADWSFASCPPGGPVVASATQICNPAGFKPGVLYELIYRARDPLVLGLGFAGVRDLISFFKHARSDDAGTVNPLWIGGDDDEEDRPLAVAEGSSQSGRAIRSFLDLGFNEDEEGRIVFEGAYPHIGGGRLAMNIRFGQPGRAWGYSVDHLYPAYEFPFSYLPTHDPITRHTRGILERCLATDTCPKIFHVATSLEIWEGRQSLGFTDPLGRRDLAEPGFIRAYIMTSTQHGSAPFVPGFGPPFGDCEQQQNPNPQLETMRALWVAFTEWVRNGVLPPPSSKPSIRDGTFVRPSEVTFPSIPANAYGGVARPAVRFLHLATPLFVLDYGPSFDGLEESGVITLEPPHVGSMGYGVRVPQVDADGNDTSGILSTTVQAPTATYTGWNMGRAGRFPDGLCSLAGSYIPFARTRAERLAVGDPRPSLEERYGTHEGYVAAVRAAAARLVAERFLLQQDADRLIAQAEGSSVP